MGRLATVMCLQALLMCSSTADAQMFVGGALVGSSLGSHDLRGGSASTSYDNTNTQSMVRGVVGEAGWILSPSRSVGVEVTVPSRRIDIAQKYHYPFGGPYQREARYCEQTFLGVFRTQVKAWHGVRVNVVGGGGLVRESSRDRISLLNMQSDTYGPFSEETESTRLTIGVAGGADLATQIIPHVSVVPHFRLLVIDRGEPSNGGFSGNLGLPTVVYRAGVGIRATF